MRMNRTVMVRVSAADRARLARLADRWGCSQGEAVTRLLDAADPTSAAQRLQDAAAVADERRRRLLRLLDEARALLLAHPPEEE